MAIDRKSQGDLEATRWRDAQEIQALRDMVGVYRRGAAALAADVTALRAESERLRAALRAGRMLRGSYLIEVEIQLDEYAEDLVGAIVSAELADLEASQLEDVLVVARELTASRARRCPADARAMVRIERAKTSVRVEVQALPSDPGPAPLSIVERLSERRGTEEVSFGATTVWAQVALTNGP
jgi:hypothetical protein